MTQQQITEAWHELQAIYDANLAEYGVKWPQVGTNKQVWLAVLFHGYKNCPGVMINKNQIAKIVNAHMPGSATDQQVRHLKRDGWYLKNDGKGGHALNPYKVSTEFVKDSIKRTDLLKDKNFQEIKEIYGNRCATCGAQEGDTNWRYGDDLVKLQKGHKDPSKPSVAENIIPQCQFCNRAYQDYYVFDDKGRVKTIASIKPVQKASKAVKQKVYEFLKNSFLF